MSLRLAVSQPITNRLHYSHSDFNKTTKQKIGPPADTVIVTSSEITAREPQQNPVLVFSITLTQKRVRPPVWIILVLHAELASVRALLVKGLDHSNVPSTLKLVCDAPSLLQYSCTHTHKTIIRKCKYKFSRTHIHGTHCDTHTHKYQHRNTCTPHLQILDDHAFRHILQHHSCVCLIIPDSIECSNLILFTCSTLLLRLYRKKGVV